MSPKQFIYINKINYQQYKKKKKELYICHQNKLNMNIYIYITDVCILVVTDIHQDEVVEQPRMAAWEKKS